MPKKNLTEAMAAKLKPPPQGQQIDYFDAGMPGLVLRINYGGRKTWRALYYVPAIAKSGKKAGKRILVPTMHSLGQYPHLKLKEARDKARQFLADPQKALAQAQTGSFQEIAENFLKRHVEANKLRSQTEIERLLKKYVYPTWQHRPFRELKRGDVVMLMDKLEDDHGSRQADMVLAIIRKVMNWYQSRNDDYVSPVVRGMKRTTGDRTRRRILADEEIRAVVNTAKEAGTFGAIIQVLLLTAQRREKVATMKWTDIVDGEWRIASEPREKSNAGSLKLPQAVLEIIEAQPRVVANPYVFAGSRQGQRKGKTDEGQATRAPEPPAFNSFSQRKEELDKKLPSMERWVLHDLRRTARSLMARAGVRPEIAERVLGHAIPGVEGVYDRHHYGEEKARALEQLAALIAGIVDPRQSNVIAMRA